MLKLAKDLDLPLDAVTRTFGILAVRGAGKSNTAAVMAEEMFGAKLPFVAIDPVGSWYGLRSSADGTSPGLSIPIFGGKHGDMPLERGAGELLADLIVEKRLTCVLDLSRFDTEADKKAFLLAFAKRLYLRNEDPLHLFLEEADDYIPQSPMGDEKHLLRAWENIVRRGRSRGLGMTIITQRSAAVAKMVLTQVETLFAMRTTGPQDIVAIEAWVKYHQVGREVLSTLSALEDGEAWVWSPHYLKTMSRHQIRRRRTFDSGATPANVRAKDTRPPATLADIDLTSLQERMAATIEKAKADDPRELRKRITDLQRQVAKGGGQANPTTAPVRQAAPTIVEKPVITDKQLQALEKATARVEALVAKATGQLAKPLQELRQQFEALHGNIKLIIQPKLPMAPVRMPPAAAAFGRQFEAAGQPVSNASKPAAPVRQSPPTRGSENLSPARQRILNALAFLHGIGVHQPDKAQVAFVAETSPNGGSYKNNVSALRTAGLIDYPQPSTVALTPAGRDLASTAGVPSTSEELHASLQAKLPPAKWRIVAALIAAYPNAMTKEDLAAAAGTSADGGSFKNNVSSLRTFGVLDYPKPGFVVATPVLFLEER